MWPSFLSFVSLYGGYLRRCFSAAGLSQQTIDIDDETTIAFWGPKPNKSTGRPSLLLLHGFGPMAIWQWRRQVQFLADDFDIYVPDLVFFGGSTTKSAERTEVFQAISVEKLLEKIGVEKYSVLGTSYGGFVAYHMARIWPERIEKVIIASSGVNMRRKDNDAMLKRANVEKIDEFLLPMTAEQLRTLMKLAVYNGAGRRMPDFFLNDFIHKLYLENREEKIELLKSLTLGREDTINLSPLFQEVLIIWGDHDQLFPLEMAKELKEIMGEKSRLEVMKDASHVPQIEAPVEFNRLVDLAGGYYDAGDNVKYGLPMAFTVTTLAWAALAYPAELEAAGEMENVKAAIQWGTDYFLKAASRRNRLYVQVGDPVKDHECWVRPENMKTPRTVLQIDSNTPGTEIAAETSAAMASSSMVFRSSNRTYARSLLNKAKLLFQFAKNHKGTYDGECPFYCSYSGFNDELLWAATWLYIATKRPVYLKYIQEESISASVAEFSWDLKYAGAQILLSKFYLQGEKGLQMYKNQADSYICSNLPNSPYHQIYISPGGMVHLRDGANTQYVAGTAFLFSAYSDILATYKQTVQCANQQFDPTHLMAFAKKQMDYMLGINPLGRSYMVGFGNNPPTQAHHRGASVPVLAPNAEVSCPMSFVEWFNKNTPNPNELTGAILGGPDRTDNFVDKRWDSPMTEPVTYTNSLAVGVLAKLAAHKF